MKEFFEFVLNSVTYPLLVAGVVLWIYGLAPQRAEGFFKLKRQGAELLASFSTFLGAALAVMPVYVPAVTREPLWYSRVITAPAFLIMIVISFVLIHRSRSVHTPLILQSVAIVALAANLFRLY